MPYTAPVRIVACAVGRRDETRNWFVETPTHLVLSFAVVRQVLHEMMESVLPE
jgi:hypothetical protein